MASELRKLEGGKKLIVGEKKVRGEAIYV